MKSFSILFFAFVFLRSVAAFGAIPVVGKRYTGTSKINSSLFAEGDVRKPQLVAKIAEKTGMTKSDSDAALSAVLDTIMEVCMNFTVVHPIYLLSYLFCTDICGSWVPQNAHEITLKLSFSYG